MEGWRQDGGVGLERMNYNSINFQWEKIVRIPTCSYNKPGRGMDSKCVIRGTTVQHLVIQLAIKETF